jgi:hypothetical protein
MPFAGRRHRQLQRLVDRKDAGGEVRGLVVQRLFASLVTAQAGADSRPAHRPA